MLSVTDGLFRETVRAVPKLPKTNGRYDDVTIAEQLVDSAVYRYDPILFVIFMLTGDCKAYSANLSELFLLS